MTDERAETEREAARRAGRGMTSHVDEHAMELSQDSRDSQSEDARVPRQDGRKKGDSTSG